MGGRAGRCLATAPASAGARQAAGGRQGPRAETLPARGLRGSTAASGSHPWPPAPGAGPRAASGPAD